VSNAIGVETTLILAGVVPMVATAALFFVARLRRDEEGNPLPLDADDQAVAGASASASGSGTPAIS
jgi:hypothetical protein